MRFARRPQRLVLAVALPLLGCYSAPRVRVVSEAAGVEILHMPPDSFPSAYYHDANFAESPPCSSRPILRHIVWIAFKEGTSAAHRMEAIRSIGGVVVGGIPINEQAFYIVRVADDASGVGACDAVRRLEAHPHVHFATIEDEA
jgi:hypothetical protein